MSTFKSIILERKLALSLIVVLCVCSIFVYMRILYVSEQRRRLLKEDIYSDDLDFEENQMFIEIKLRQMKAFNIRYIKRAIKRINEEEKIYNLNRFSPLRKWATVFVIQVDSRISFLQSLVESLEHITGIGNSLIIFSHSYYDEEINNLVKDIRFTKVMQIFYPYSVQLHPYIFPGQDKDYCDSNWACWKSEGQRDPDLAQKKHHWWWMMNQVFDRLRVTANYDGRIVFLEEDQYLTQDIIYVIRLMEKVLPHICRNCQILNLGAYSPNMSQYHVTEGVFFVEIFGGTEFNKGIAFNRTFWNIIKNSSANFCYYKDYRWDNTLKYIASRRSEGRFYMLTSEGNRVFHIDKCEDYRDDCEIENKKQVVYHFVEKISKGLYPLNIAVKPGLGVDRNVSEIGGWSDVRDHELCMFIASKQFNSKEK